MEVNSTPKLHIRRHLQLCLDLIFKLDQSKETIIVDDVFESYMLAQTKISPYLNKINLVNPEPQQPNNSNLAEFNKFK
jgi:hypothetical protein